MPAFWVKSRTATVLRLHVSFWYCIEIYHSSLGSRSVAAKTVYFFPIINLLPLWRLLKSCSRTRLSISTWIYKKKKPICGYAFKFAAESTVWKLRHTDVSGPSLHFLCVAKLTFRCETLDARGIFITFKSFSAVVHTSMMPWKVNLAKQYNAWLARYIPFYGISVSGITVHCSPIPFG